MTISVPGPKLGSMPPAAFVRTTRRAPSRLKSRIGWTTSPGSLPSYMWNRPFSMATGVSRERARGAAARRGRARSPRASRAGPRTGSRRGPRRRRRARRARSRGRCRRPGRGRSARERGLERVEAGGLLRGRDRPGRGRSGGPSTVGHGRAGLQERVQGGDGRGPRLRSPDGRTDTGMPVAIRRAIARGPDSSRASRATKRPKRPVRTGGP